MKGIRCESPSAHSTYISSSSCAWARSGQGAVGVGGLLSEIRERSGCTASGSIPGSTPPPGCEWLPENSRSFFSASTNHVPVQQVAWTIWSRKFCEKEEELNKNNKLKKLLLLLYIIPYGHSRTNRSKILKLTPSCFQKIWNLVYEEVWWPEDDCQY